MFTAATPSAPTPCPTNIPSIAVTAHIEIVPHNVGISNLRKSVETFSFSKSMTSLFIAVSLCQIKIPGK